MKLLTTCTLFILDSKLQKLIKIKKSASILKRTLFVTQNGKKSNQILKDIIYNKQVLKC